MSSLAGLAWHEQCMWHDTTRSAGPNAEAVTWIEPGVPGEGPEARRRLKNLLDASGMTNHLSHVAPVGVEAELAAVHDTTYLDLVRQVSRSGGGLVGPNAPIGPGGYEIAALASGVMAGAVDAVMSRTVRRAYALARPAGHHAGRSSGQGNCVFNSVAVGAVRAQSVWDAQRVAIVDWDVHHGNGTEQIFLDDPSVLTISLHQEDWYPRGSGSVATRGSGAAEGTNINIPLPAGSGCGAYLAAIDQIVIPALYRHDPDLILVACGFDASAMDPYGRMLLTSESFAAMTNRVLAVAESLCEGRVVLHHEGGYSPIYVPFCGLAVIERLAEKASGVADPFLQRYQGAFQALTPAQAEAVERARPDSFVEEDLHV